MLYLASTLAAAAPWTTAQDELRGEHLALDGLIRGAGRWEVEPDVGDQTGVRWQSVRARLSGAHGPLRWVLQGEAAPTVRPLDAWMSIEPHRAVRLTVGHHRPPVSREMLTPIEQLVFTERATAVRRLAPAWDWGATLSGRLKAFRWDLGVYESGWLQRDGALPLVAARVGLDLRMRPGMLQVEVAGAASQDVDTPWAGARFSGRRALGTLGLQWQSVYWLVAGELLFAALLPDVARDDFPVGGHLTAQARPTRFGSLEARVDSYSRTFTPGLLWEARFGGTLTPIAPVQAKVHYVVPLHRKRLGDHALELALQLAL